MKNCGPFYWEIKTWVPLTLKRCWRQELSCKERKRERKGKSRIELWKSFETNNQKDVFSLFAPPSQHFFTYKNCTYAKVAFHTPGIDRKHGIPKLFRKEFSWMVRNEPTQGILKGALEPCPEPLKKHNFRACILERPLISGAQPGVWSCSGTPCGTWLCGSLCSSTSVRVHRRRSPTWPPEGRRALGNRDIWLNRYMPICKKSDLVGKHWY